MKRGQNTAVLQITDGCGQECCFIPGTTASWYNGSETAQKLFRLLGFEIRYEFIYIFEKKGILTYIYTQCNHVFFSLRTNSWHAVIKCKSLHSCTSETSHSPALYFFLPISYYLSILLHLTMYSFLDGKQ